MKRMTMHKKFQRVIPMIYLQMAEVIICTLDVGGYFKIFSIGGSVERAIAAKVSMMRLIQRS
jgi:hypothetical protein